MSALTNVSSYLEGPYAPVDGEDDFEDLPVVGALYVTESISVILQVGSFRIFKRRIFRMAPIHHHFELGGWPETTLIVRFWLLAGACTAVALGLFYADFISLGVLE